MDKDYFETLRGSVQEPVQVDTTSTESTGMATLTVKVDIDCKLYSDGDFLDLFEANKVKKIPIEVGQHLITIESEHYDGVSEDHVIDAAEAGKNYLLLVNGLKQKEQDAIQEENTKEIDMLLCKGKECYSNGDYESAFNMFKQAAEHGNAEAQYMLAACYFKGKGAPENIEQALIWFEKSALQGYPMAQYELGCIYNVGSVIPVDKAKSARWYKMAAEQGNIIAQVELGKLYYYGMGVFRDQKEAAKWFEKAAKQKNSEAMCMLGICFYYGLGVPESIEKAVSLWKESAKDDNPQSQFQLGVYYKEWVEDEADAIKWLTMSAENGYEPAQSLLGMIYANFESDVCDYSSAIKWYKASADQGNKESKIRYEGWNCLYKHNYEEAYSLFEQEGFEEDIESLKGLVFQCEEDDEIALKWFVKIGDQEYIQYKKNEMKQKFRLLSPGWDYWFPEESSDEDRSSHCCLSYNPDTGEFDEQK